MSNVQFMQKYINTILLSVISLLLLYGVATISNLTTAQNDMRVDLAVLSKTILDHNVNSDFWIEEIKKNSDNVDDIKLGNVVATSDRYTKTEAIANLANIRLWVERNYKTK